MTPSQERKFDDMYRTVLEIQGDMKVYKSEQLNHLEAIIKNVKDINNLREDVDGFKADRNKVVGVSWLGGGILALGGLIYEVARHL